MVLSALTGPSGTPPIPEADGESRSRGEEQENGKGPSP